jgi:hypothetical protein
MPAVAKHLEGPGANADDGDTVQGQKWRPLGLSRQQGCGDETDQAEASRWQPPALWCEERKVAAPMSQVIRCRCEGNDRDKVIVVLNDDGSVEKRAHGKTVRFGGPGTVGLSCERCGFQCLIPLDKNAGLVVA